MTSTASYTSETPFEVWCIIRTEGDGYTYSSEAVVAVFLAKEDAETALLDYLSKLEKHRREASGKLQQINELAAKLGYQHPKVMQANKDLRQWCLEQRGQDTIDFHSVNLEDYEIRPMRIGEFQT